MLFDNPFLLVINLGAIALSLSFSLIVLWYNLELTSNQFFALFLLFVCVWVAATLVGDVVPVLGAGYADLIRIADNINVIGFVGASVSLYALVTVAVGVHTRRFRRIAFISLALIVGYSAFLIVIGTTQPTTYLHNAFYLLFSSITVYILWAYRRKFDDNRLFYGVLIFVAGQTLTVFNPSIGITSLATTLGSVGALIISIAFIQQQMITPLRSRNAQVEAMHNVSLALTKQLATNTVLQEITKQAVEWLDADGACILLNETHFMHVVASENMPTAHHALQLKKVGSIPGEVAISKQSIFVENYARDWDGDEHLPFAKETFGSVICSPMILNTEVTGTLLVVAGIKGRLFSQSDVRMLELLCSQAAVVLSHGQLFTDLRELTRRLTAAHNQLMTVLSSTQNPVLAIDRQMRLLIANPTAQNLFNIDETYLGSDIRKWMSDDLLPTDIKGFLRTVHDRNVFVYEISLDSNIFQCYVAAMRSSGKIEGWVAILNDVTELKELDRLKSEMVRMTSHDLKNPLQAAMANLDLLRDDLSDLFITKEIQISADNIEKQLIKMHRIISGILDMERLRAGVQLSEICNPDIIIRDAVDEVLDLATEKSISIKLDVAGDVREFWGATNHFKRAIVNLLENAIKFSDTDSTVSISAYNHENDIWFCVADNGIGMSHDVMKHVFERFYRGKQRGVEHVSGSGLGLSFVQSIVLSHNGRTWVSSAVGKGSVFYIAVPAISSNHLESGVFA